MTNAKATWLGLGLVLILAGTWAGYGGLSGHGFGSSDPGCTLEAKEAPDGSVPVLAVCDWDVPAERLHAMLRSIDSHDQTFSNLAESTVLDESDGVYRTRQVHSASGISDRVAIVDFTITEVPGGVRYEWTKSADQSEGDGYGLEAVKNDGMWEVVENGSGSRVTYKMSYSPGGSVPFFVMRWFQGAGVRGVLTEFRDTAEAGVFASR